MRHIHILLLAALITSAGCIAPPAPPTSAPADMSAALDMTPDMGQDPERDMTAPPLPDLGERCIGGFITGFYRICDAAGLEEMRVTPGGNFELGADITLPANWKPIEEFSGTLDGKGYTISGIDLGARRLDESMCNSLNRVIVGGFIDKMTDGVMRDVRFQGISGEEEGGTPLSSDLGASDESCLVQRGGVFGLVFGSREDPILFEDIYINDLDVKITRHFGALAFRISGARLENVHLLGAPGVNTIASLEGSIGGLVYALVESIADKISAQVSVSGVSDAAKLSNVGLLASIGSTSTISRAVARGTILSTGSDSSSVVGGLFGRVVVGGDEMFTLERCAFDPPVDIEQGIAIDARSASSGGLIGYINATPLDATGSQVEPGELDSVSISHCRVGHFTSDATIASTLRAREFSGGVVGRITTATESSLTLRQVFINTIQEGEVESNGVSCHAPTAINESGDPGPMTNVTGGAPDPVDSDDVTLRCDGLMSVESITPEGWTHYPEQARYDITDIEDFFGPLRDQNAPPSK